MFSFNFIEPFIVIPYDTRILFWNEVVDTVRPPTTRINKIKMSGVYISLVKRRQTLVRIFNSFIDRKFEPPSLMVNINYGASRICNVSRNTVQLLVLHRHLHSWKRSILRITSLFRIIVFALTRKDVSIHSWITISLSNRESNRWDQW